MKIAFIDPLGLPYDARTVTHRGLGGSESAVIYMSTQLHKLGWQVSVFCHCDQGSDTAPGVYDGVTYMPLDHIRSHECDFDVVVSSRSVEPWVPVHLRESFTRRDMSMFDRLQQSACHKVLWMHDTFCFGDQILEYLVVNNHIHELFTLSDWHTNYILNCDHGNRRNYEVLKHRTFVTRNGVTNWLDWVDPAQKDPDLFVYNASVSKGMTTLLTHVWPQFKQHVPQARLKIVGGYYKFRPQDPPDEQEQKWHALRERYDNQLGVQFTGIIPQKQIAEVLAQASMMMYPAAFPETFGISALESINYLTPIITNRFGALEETALDLACYKLEYAIEPNSLFPWINTQDQVSRFVNLAVQAHRNTYLLQQKQHYCGIVRPWVGWDKVALEWDQHLCRLKGVHYPVHKYRQVRRATQRLQQIFGRRMTNLEQHVPEVQAHQPILIISCMRNGAAYVTKCMESVAAQDYPEYTHVLVDDASDDHTVQVVEDFMHNLSEDLKPRFQLWQNDQPLGAPHNQHRVLTWAQQHMSPHTIVMLLDGDDHLVNQNHIFAYYNQLFDDHTQFTYGSCWSLADQIPLVAQDYPPHVKANRSYRSHKFNWIMPYTHLRAFRLHLFDHVKESDWQNAQGEWYTAGGDTAVFYSLIEQADPEKVHAVKDVVVNYNDVNPLNDYKVHTQLQNLTAQSVIMRSTQQHTQSPQCATSVTTTASHQSAAHTVSRVFGLNESDAAQIGLSRYGTGNNCSTTSPLKILIAVPTSRYIEVETFKSIYDQIKPEGCEVHFQYFWGYNVEQVRNIQVNWMLQNGFDYMFCVDSDIILPADALVRLLSAQSHSVGITSGVYVQRKDTEKTPEIYVTNPHTGGHDRMSLSDIQADQVLPAAAVGFGCCLVHRRVFESVGNPWFEYKSNIEFDKVISEDVTFCVKATQKGFHILVDTQVKCGHVHKTVLTVM
jgi:glycosyltransferase involved in cell wall biosynthesis